MNGRVLIVEPDAAGRAIMDRVLATEGFCVEAVAAIDDAREQLEATAFDLAVVDELAGARGLLDEVRRLRREYPALPLVVTGTLLTQRVMQELLRLRVADALVKPFTPSDLRVAVTRLMSTSGVRHTDALEYSAAITSARRAITSGLVARARPALARALAVSPFDAEAMALRALVAEIEGQDADADRGYRAALALRTEEDSPPPSPHEGLARLHAYDGALPVTALRPDRVGIPAWIVTDPVRELGTGSPYGAAPHVIVLPLGLGGGGDGDATGAVFLRDGDGPRAFALMTGTARPEAIAAVLRALGSVAFSRSRERVEERHP